MISLGPTVLANERNKRKSTEVFPFELSITTREAAHALTVAAVAKWKDYCTAFAKLID